MPKNIGYLLPDGEAFTDELACMILFYPDKREYRQALFGSLDGLSHWLNWERDDDKRGKDAARAWKLANIATRNCWDMNTCELLLEKLDRMIALQETCCVPGGDYVTYIENIVVTTTIIPESGTVPEYWGEQETADWDEWLEYVCGQAHALVDDIIDTIGHLEIAGTVTGYVLDFIAHLFSLVQWRMVEDIIPVNFSLIQTIINGFGELLIGLDYDQLAQDVEDARDDIVCSLILGTDLGDEIEAALTGEAGILWDAYFQFIDWDTTTAQIYTGGNEDTGYLPVLQADTCSGCGVAPLEEGANLELAEITAIDWYDDYSGQYNTVHSINPISPGGYVIDVTCTTGVGVHFYVELTLAASAYSSEPDADFRGITYYGVKHTNTGTEYAHQAVAGDNAVQVQYPVGHGRWLKYYGLHSEPYAGFEDECEVIIGEPYKSYLGTNGLELEPTVERKLYLRFTHNSAERYYVRIPALYWAINYAP